MNVEEIVDELIELGVRLEVEQGNLKIIGLKKEDAPLVLPKLKANKQAILDYVSELMLNSNIAEKKSSINKVETAESYKLSPEQFRLWFICQFHTASSAYNMPALIPLKGAINIDFLEKSINTVIDRHENLRTIFKKDENGLVKQFILPKEKTVLKVKEIDFTDSMDKENQTETFFYNDAFQPFHLEQWPLIRVTLIKLTDDEYKLYYNIHHIISDAQSIAILLSEVFEYYEKIKSNKWYEPEKLRIQYKDYCAHRNTWLTSEECHKMQSFWKNELSGNISLINLPSQLKRPQVSTFNGALLKTTLSPNLTAQIKSYCQDHGASLFTGLVSCLNALLYRYSGESNITIGTPVLGRDQEELENLIGFFVNTVVLRNNLNGNQTYDELFENTRLTIISAFMNGKYPFDKIVEDLKVKRDTSRNNLFDIMISMQNTDINKAQENTTILSEEIIKIDGIASKFDLEIIFDDSTTQISMGVIYNTDVYESEMLIPFIQSFKILSEQLVNNSTTKIDTLNILGKSEKIKLFAKNVKIDLDNPTCSLLDLFYKKVSENPDKIVAIFKDETLSFRSLNEKSQVLATFLVSCRIVKEEMVPLCLDRSLEMLVAIVGVMKAGGAYVPLDPEYSEERTHFIINDIAANKIITNSVYQERFSSVKNVINLDHFDYSEITPFKVECFEKGQLCYVIYTSGTTGLPKGVCCKESGLMNRLEWMRKDLKLDQESVILQKTPYTFDVSVWEFFMPLITGGKLVFAEPNGHKDVRYLYKSIKKHQISIIHFVPSMLKLFLEDFSADNCPYLKKIICSGEEFPIKLARKCKQLLNVDLYNYYGPTEASIDVTALEITNDALLNDVLSIGTPAPNVEIYIVNNQFQLQPEGVIGEILIGGVQVADKYLNRPELNAQKFITNDLSIGPLFKTGDLGRWISNGEIEFLGRGDDQVKIRGNRIELGEINQALKNVHGVIDAIVVARENDLHEKELIGYLILEDKMDVKNLRSKLIQKLPSYMIPQYFQKVDYFPLTSNGKIDKKGFPELTDSNNLIVTSYIPASTELEKTVVLIWETFFDSKKIGLNADFFELGGQSLILLQLAKKYHDKFQVHLSVDQLFKKSKLSDHVHLIKHADEKHFHEKKLITLNNIESTKANMILIPPITGNSAMYIPFASKFDRHFNCYSVNYPGVEFNEELAESIELMVNDILNQIIDHKFTHIEKLFILGYSMGATIAFQLVQELEKMNYNCELILVDRPPNTNKNIQETGNWDEAETQTYLNDYIRQFFGNLDSETTQNFKKFLYHYNNVLNRFRTNGLIQAKTYCIQGSEISDFDMKDWRNWVKGEIMLDYFKCDHYEIFSEKQLDFLVNLISLKIIN